MIPYMRRGKWEPYRTGKWLYLAVLLFIVGGVLSFGLNSNLGIWVGIAAWISLFAHFGQPIKWRTKTDD